MQYLIVFFEGIVTFVSPCLLPMLPVYVSYFMGSEEQEKKGRALKNSLGFVLGFGIVFVLLGAFAGTIGTLLVRHRTAVNIVSGAIIFLLGLNYTGLIHIAFLNKARGMDMGDRKAGFFSSVLLGIVFSIGWTPCVGAFLGSALLLASQQASFLKGLLMLVLYSVGLGIPFVLSAVLLSKLRRAFSFIKRHYQTINLIAGVFLMIVGILTALGLMSRLVGLLI